MHGFYHYQCKLSNKNTNAYKSIAPQQLKETNNEIIMCIALMIMLDKSELI